MGNYKKGVLGSFSGKIGTVIGSKWMGTSYMRSLPEKSSKEPTEKQLAQRTKFALAVNFVRPLTGLFHVGYRNQATEMSAFNVAVQQVLTEAITGTYPSFAIDYPNVKISKGNLAMLSGDRLESTTFGAVTLIWKDNTDTDAEAHADDELMALVYNPAKGRSVFRLKAALRSEETYTFTLPSNFSDDEVYVYAAFVDRDGEVVSETSYLGSRTVL